METGGAGGVKGAGRGTRRPRRDASRGASQHGLRSMVNKVGGEGSRALDRGLRSDEWYQGMETWDREVCGHGRG